MITGRRAGAIAESTLVPDLAQPADPGDFSWVLHNLAHGAVAYLAPEDGSSMPANHIPLDGSLYAINAALAFCAPRVPVEPKPDAGVDHRTVMEKTNEPPPARTQ